MNPSPAVPAPHRHVWRWVLLGAGLCLTPLVVLGLVAVSYLTLDRDVAVLRHHVMAATDTNWTTRVQFSVGGLTLTAIQQGLRFVQKPGVEDARLALRAVRRADVGVYSRASDQSDWSRAQLFHDTDEAMDRRGWARLVGVADGKETVLIYAAKDLAADGPVKLCLAVLDRQELVVVSTTVDATALGEIVARHAGDDLKKQLRLAQLRF